MRTIQISLVRDFAEEPDLVHRLRNYGEDVYHYVKDGGKGMGEVDIEEVDAAKDRFFVRRVANSKVLTLRRWIEEEGARQNLRIVTQAI